MGLGPSGAGRVAAALLAGPRPSVLWLSFAGCTACTETFLRAVNPYIDDLILGSISLDYHETLLAGSGDSATALLSDTAVRLQGQFFAVVEGAIPTSDHGNFGAIGGTTMLNMAGAILPLAKAIIAIGSCSSYGGIQAALPNPTGAMGVKNVLPSLSVPVVNVPGCPPNPLNVVGVIVNYLLNGTLPGLDSNGRPRFAYGSTVHDNCPFQGDSTRCLIQKGCKGPVCYNNCPTIGFNEGTSFCMKAGHPCIGCSEPDFWDRMPSFYYKNYQDVAVKPGPVSPHSAESGKLQKEIFDVRGRRIGVISDLKQAGVQARKQPAPGAYIGKSSRKTADKIITGGL